MKTLGLMQPAPPERLAAFRILSGTFALGYLIARWPFLLDVTRLDPSRWHPPGVLSLLPEPLSPSLAQGLLVLTVAIGAASTAGWRFQWTGPAFAALLLGVLTYRNSWGHLFHADNLLALHVGVVGLAPSAEAWSLDARRRRTPLPADVRYGWPLRLAAIVTVLTYVVTGVAKLRYAGTGWLSGDTLLHQITFDNARKRVLGSPYSPLAAPLAAHPGLVRPFGLATLVVELGAPVALLSRRWALAWASAAWLFHLGIVALMAISFPYPLSIVAFAPFFRCERPFHWIRVRVRGDLGDRLPASERP